MIQQRRGGWKVTVYAGLDPLTGRRRYVTRQVNGSYKQAKKKEAELITEVAGGKHTTTRAATFGQLLDRWLAWRVGNGKRISPHTVDVYRSLIDKRIKPALGSKPLHKVTAPVLDAFYEELGKRGSAWADRHARARARAQAQAAGAAKAAVKAAVARARPTAEERRLSSSSLQDVHAVISGALGLAVRWGWLPVNPASGGRPARSKGAKRPVPTAGQVRELFAAAAGEPDFEAFLRLSATTGLRPGEICAIRWCDLDLDAMVVDVNGAIVTGKGLANGFVRTDTKSIHGERLIALDARTVGLLHGHHDRCKATVEDFDGTLAADGYVFARTPDGTMPMRPDAISRRFSAFAAQLGHPYTLYGLRHFMATQLGAVASVNTLRQRMGHGSLAVTSGYTHYVDEADRAAARFMADLLDGSGASPDGAIDRRRSNEQSQHPNSVRG